MSDVLLIIGGALLMLAAGVTGRVSVNKKPIDFTFGSGGEEGGLDANKVNEPLLNSLLSVPKPYEVTKVKVNRTDLDVLARTMWGEARNEGRAGMQAVANVVMNRVNSRRFPNTAAKVCKQPWQFSVWNKGDPNLEKMKRVTISDSRFKLALEIAEKALSGNLRDITGGADHYLNIAFTNEIRGGSLPHWVNLDKKTTDIGRHTFLKLV